MKRILSSRRYYIWARVCVFFITAALITGTVGCTEIPVVTLTITSTEGGSVTTPGEGTFTYNEGTIVNLVAETDEGYVFFGWTGNVSHVEDVNDATTYITMSNDYSITADFNENLQIRDWYDLDAVRNNLSGNHTLMNNLDSTTAGYEELASPTANQGKGWEPIGYEEDQYDSYQIHPFIGTFNGQGYKICDLFINRPDEIPVGLFRIVLSGAHIENIGVVNVTVIGGCEVGGLVGHIQDAIIYNSYVTGNITSERYKAGGLVGCMSGTSVSNSYSTGNVNGHSDVGGLVGDNWRSNVINSYSTANVNGNYYVGGLLGHLTFGTVSNSYYSGIVNGDNYIGGMVGSNVDGTVSNSFWDTETSGQATSAGGTGKNTTEMQDITTFSGASWDIIGVADSDTRNPSYIWNILNYETYPFLSWQPV